MRGNDLPQLQSERLRRRFEALRGEAIVVPDWRATGLRAIVIGLLFGVWLGSRMEILPVADWVADAALAGAAFLLGVNFAYLKDRRLWLEKTPVYETEVGK